VAIVNGTATLLAGSTTTTFTVTVNGDLNYENNESYTATISSPTNATILTATGTGHIFNDDAIPVLSINDVSIAEGNSGTSALTFTVTRTGFTDLLTSFNYSTFNGTASTFDNDYVARSGSTSIAI